jgi:hypothetical protein
MYSTALLFILKVLIGETNICFKKTDQTKHGLIHENNNDDDDDDDA